MHPSAFLLAALVFAVPSSVFCSEMTAARSEALYALNASALIGPSAAGFGRFFDAAARRGAPTLTAPRPSVPARAPSRGPRWVRRRPLRRPVPFKLTVPAVPPLPFQRAFERLVLKREASGFDAAIARHAGRSGLDPRLVKSVIAAESEFTARAVSPAGALGLMQVMPATAREMGVGRASLFDPDDNIRAGTLYLAHLFARAWRRYHLKGVPYSRAPEWLVQRVIAAYNAGPRFLARRRLYSQTRDYVRKVLLFYRSKVTELRAA